jgi:hypothetical protein
MNCIRFYTLPRKLCQALQCCPHYSSVSDSACYLHNCFRFCSAWCLLDLADGPHNCDVKNTTLNSVECPHNCVSHLTVSDSEDRSHNCVRLCSAVRHFLQIFHITVSDSTESSYNCVRFCTSVTFPSRILQLNYIPV